ncbi:putative ribonuclease H-like domain-containing protein [Tanacetum coccineum]
MTGNIAYLLDFREFDGVYVTFGGGAHGGRISGKGTLKTDSLDFEDATSDESMLWHKRLGHINFKNINKLVKDNRVRGLPTKRFENDQTCVACLKLKGSNTELLVCPKLVLKKFNADGQHVNMLVCCNTGSFKLNTVDPSVNTASSYDQDSPKDMFTIGASHTLEATHVEFFSDEDEPEVDLGNITNSYTVLNTPNTRIHNDHPIENVIGDVKSYVQTRRMTKPTSKQGFLNVVYEQKIHDTLNTCLYACFLSQIEPTSIVKALSDSSWVEEMQEKLLQFKLQQVWILMDLPIGKRAIGTKWVFRNKKDKRGIMIRNKARLVAQGFKDPDHPDKVYKVVKALYGLHQAPRAWDASYELVAYTDSDYAGATQDRKSTTGGCQFLGNRLISWQCKKQTVVVTSTTEAEYVAAASCYLLTKGFVAGRFQYLVSSVEMLNP